jgi:protein TIF31
MAALHRFDVPNLYTLATVLVDYLGTRYVCQSIVPGILQGEKTHTLVYGAVQASAPLAWDSDMHDLLELYIGKHAMCATRVQPTQPLTHERIEGD